MLGTAVRVVRPRKDAMSSCLYELDEEMPGGPWNVMDEKAGYAAASLC